MHKILSSENWDTFTSMFLFLPSVFFSCHIALAKTSTTVLNRSVENIYPCLISDFSV